MKVAAAGAGPQIFKRKHGRHASATRAGGRGRRPRSYWVGIGPIARIGRLVLTLSPYKVRCFEFSLFQLFGTRAQRGCFMTRGQLFARVSALPTT